MSNNLWSIVTGREFWHGPAPLVVGLLVAANLGVWVWNDRLVQQRRQNLTTGDQAALASSDRYEATFGENPLASWDSIPDARQQPLVILCGMSQMFTINDRQAGDQTISEELDDRLTPLGVRVYGLAAPNLCNEEALLLLLALLQSPETKPRAFIYGACFDKFRNVDLRPGYQSLLKARPELQQAWQQTAESLRDKYPMACEKMLQSLREVQANPAGSDESIEGRLREIVAARVPVVSARKELNSQVQWRLYSLRNELLGIKNETKRPMIQGRYDMNCQFMELMLDVAAEAGVDFLTYVIPLNPSAKNPYVPAEYAAFKAWLGELATGRQVPLANLENLVPAEEWGQWLGGPDFKHFKGAAHRRTAEQLLEEFGPQLKPADRGGAAP